MSSEGTYWYDRDYMGDFETYGEARFQDIIQGDKLPLITVAALISLAFGTSNAKELVLGSGGMIAHYMAGGDGLDGIISTIWSATRQTSICNYGVSGFAGGIQVVVGDSVRQASQQAVDDAYLYFSSGLACGTVQVRLKKLAHIINHGGKNRPGNVRDQRISRRDDALLLHTQNGGASRGGSSETPRGSD